MKKALLLLLFLPPALLVWYWYSLEYQVIRPFTEFTLVGLENISPDEARQDYGLLKTSYEKTKDSFITHYEQLADEESNFTDFNKGISEGIIEKIGILSSLPYHKVCLINNNKFYIENSFVENPPKNIGGIAIKQKEGYNFSAPRGGWDCKDVQIDKFRKSSTTQELGYMVAISINEEENEKRLRGDAYLVNLATTTVKTSETKIVISLKIWILVLAYLAVLFAWSFIFFQYQKIYNFLAKMLGNT